MILDLMMDLRKASGDKSKEGAAYARFNESKRAAPTVGDAATALLRDCAGPDGKRLVSTKERVELVSNQLLTVPLN